MSTSFVIPPDSCDCHVHVVGEMSAYPMLTDRPYTAGPASAEALRDHLGRLGLTRAVIVQPSFYGTDNRCSLDGVQHLRGAGRAVAVLDPQWDIAALQALHAQGTRGIRINLESLGDRDPQTVVRALTFWAARIAPLGWHIQVYARADVFGAAAPQLHALGVPIVLDHFAMIPAKTALNAPEVQAILSLVERGNAYVKLSGSYRIDPQVEAPDAVTQLAHTLLAANPKRILWGSDWPHTQREPGRAATQVSGYRAVSGTAQFNELQNWLADPVWRRQVLVENPARLYGF